jgi:hypothetical protein
MYNFIAERATSPRRRVECCCVAGLFREKTDPVVPDLQENKGSNAAADLPSAERGRNVLFLL